jgi:amino acid adenylation domain-containing protein
MSNAVVDPVIAGYHPVLVALGEVHGLEPSLVLAAAGAVLVHRLNGKDTPTIATVGGTHDEQRRLARVDLSPDVTFRQLLRSLSIADGRRAGAADVVVGTDDGGWCRFPTLPDAARDGALFRERMRTLVDALTADLDRPVYDVPVVGPAERARVLSFNPTPVRAADLPVHEAICRQAARTPDRVAVCGPHGQLTYREVMDRAGLLAGRLRSAGIGPGSVVGSSATQGVDAVVTAVGVLLAGGVYLPLDPALSRPVHEKILRSCGATALPAGALTLAGANAPAVEPDPAFDWRSYRTPAEVAAGLAYVVAETTFGVEVTHRGLASRLAALQAEHRLTAQDVVLHQPPYAAAWELLWPLRYGARVAIAPPGTHLDARALLRTIRRERVTTVHIVPSMLARLVDEPGLERSTSLRTVLCSGEVLPPKTVNRLTARLPVEVVNLYGRAETTTGATAWRCRPPEPPGRSTGGVPIGRPTRNTAVYVLEPGGNLAPIGGRGELYVGGATLARGYRGEVDAERFVEIDVAGRPERVLRTGDLARWTADGVLEYLGRVDEEVRIRGRRVDLRGVEALLEADPLVRHAVVLTDGAAALVAYVVPEADAALDEPALRCHLRDHLDHVVPVRIARLDRLPLAPDGRLDRTALQGL